MARSKGKIRLWYFSFIGYFFSIMFFAMIFTGGTASRTGANLKIDPIVAAAIGAIFFITGSLFLLLSVILYIYRKTSRQDRNRWRGRK